MVSPGFFSKLKNLGKQHPPDAWDVEYGGGSSPDSWEEGGQGQASQGWDAEKGRFYSKSGEKDTPIKVAES